MEHIGKYQANTQFNNRSKKMAEYHIGQIFEGKYPPEAAIWCNKNNAYIEKIADNRYEIKEVPAPSEAEINAGKIVELKEELASTDYKAIKFAEGWLTEEEYAPIKAERQAIRDKINQLLTQE